MKKARRNVAKRTVPLPERVIGMPTKRGKVSKQRERYYLTVGRRKLEIPIGPVVSRREIDRLVGKEVHVAFSRKRPTEIVAIGTWPTPEKPVARRVPCYWIMCYVPAPDLIRRVQPTVRAALIRKMVNEGVITPQLGRQIGRGIPG